MMAKNEAYLYYEAGQAVAAAHLGLDIRRISGNPATTASEIVLPRSQPKARMILWLTGMAAEKKGVGKSDPLRRMRNRARMRSKLEAVMLDLKGSRAKRLKETRSMLSQSQDRANAICTNLFDAIEQVAKKLRTGREVTGETVVTIVRAVKAKRSAQGKRDDDD
jgi:hypothetical protein